MKYLIASDIHGSACYCSLLLKLFESEKADRLVLLGDVLYHGPRNDLPKEYAPKQVIEMLSGYADRILAVRGNCEAEVDQMVLPFPVLADYAVLDISADIAEKVKDTAGGEAVTNAFSGEIIQTDYVPNGLIYLTHGHHYNINAPLPMTKGSTMIYGHTHVPVDEIRDGVRFLNPGSVSIPKNESAHGCFILDKGIFKYRVLESC